MKNRGNENGRIDGRRYFIACLTRRKSSLSLETNAPSPVHWDSSSTPVHPSIRPPVHYFTSFIQAPESNHNSTPIERKSFRDEANLRSPPPLRASSASNRVTRLLDILFFSPIIRCKSVKGITSNRISKF